MTINFYYMMGSPPCSTVSMTIAALGIESEIKYHSVDCMADEHLKPEYIKMNPQHTVPTIEDDGFVLWESRAISRYLVNKYGKGSALYPEDVQARAVIDQRLDFDLGTLYSRFMEYYYPKFFEGKTVEESGLKRIHEALGFLDTFLADNKYAAGSVLTLADLSLVVTVTVLEAAGNDLKEYPNIVRWYDLVKSTAPNYKTTNGKYAEEFRAFFGQFAKN